MLIRVFRDKDDVKKVTAENKFDTISRVKSGRIAVLSKDEFEMMESQGEMYYLVQGNEVKGIAFSYNDAHKGFRILAHQQYIEGDNDPNPVEIVSRKNMEFEPVSEFPFTLKYVLLNY